MGNIPLPALTMRPPERPPDQINRLVQLRSLLGQQMLQQQLAPMQVQGELDRFKAAQMQNQQLQYTQGRTNAIRSAYQNALKVRPGGTASIDNGKLLKNLAVAGHGATIPAIMKNIRDYQTSLAHLEETSGKLQALQQDMMGSLGAALKNARYDPNLADLLIQERLGQPNLPANTRLQLVQMQRALQANPEMVRSVADNLVAQSPKQRALAAQQMMAQARKQQTNLATRKAGMVAPAAGSNQSIPQTLRSGGSSRSTGAPLHIRLTNGRGLVIP